MRYISHELRTPLNTAFLGLKLLVDDFKDSEDEIDKDRFDTIEAVNKSVLHAVEILNGILTFDRIEAGLMELSKQDVKIASMVADCVSSFRREAIEDGKLLRLFIPQTTVIGHGADHPAAADGSRSNDSRHHHVLRLFNGLHSVLPALPGVSPHASMGRIPSEHQARQEGSGRVRWGNFGLRASSRGSAKMGGLSQSPSGSLHPLSILQPGELPVTEADFVHGDAHKLRRVLDNLVSIAVKFGKRHAIVRVTFVPDPEGDSNDAESEPGDVDDAKRSGKQDNKDEGQDEGKDAGREQGKIDGPHEGIAVAGGVPRNVLDRARSLRGASVSTSRGRAGSGGSRRPMASAKSLAALFRRNNPATPTSSIPPVNGVSGKDSVGVSRRTGLSAGGGGRNLRAEGQSSRRVVSRRDRQGSGKSLGSKVSSTGKLQALRRVFSLDNKVSPPSPRGRSSKGGSSSLLLSVRGQLRIVVTDDGVGMSEANQQRLFTEIVQFNPELLQAGGGSGFGLYISKAIVDLHKGSLEVESKGEGQGCSFVLNIPMVRKPAPVRGSLPGMGGNKNPNRAQAAGNGRPSMVAPVGALPSVLPSALPSATPGVDPDTTSFARSAPAVPTEATAATDSVTVQSRGYPRTQTTRRSQRSGGALTETGGTKAEVGDVAGAAEVAGVSLRSVGSTATVTKSMSASPRRSLPLRSRQCRPATH